MKIKITNFFIFIICILLLDNINMIRKTNKLILINKDANGCDAIKCSPVGGICLSNDKCECMKCYTTKFTSNETYCNYSQSSSTIAGVVELFFPIGLGHFYRGSISFGFFKMISGFTMFYGIYVIVIYYFIYTRTSNLEMRQPLTGGYQTITVQLVQDVKNLKLIALLSQSLFILFHFFDVYLLLSAKYLDGNNMPLC